jgi:predicted molibdopterin-dependent oxidoreductase YjgC
MDTRRLIVNLMLANHPESCLVCDKGNRCQLRQRAAELGIGAIEYDRMPSYSGVMDLNPFMARDLSKCILCAKCIRADQELVVVGALDYLHRGFDARPATLLEGPLEGSECTFCGTCLSMCPTGALMEKGLPHRGTVGRRVATTCSYCGCGCSLWIHAVDGRLAYVTPRAEGSANQATLCVRGHYGSDYLNQGDRLLSPQVRKDGELKAVTWEEALREVAERLGDVVRRHGPRAVGFFGSTQCTNEENYLLQKIARVGLGSPHVDNGARLHAISSVLGLKEVLGVGAATNPMEDLEAAQVLFVIGAQPLESHPVASYCIKRAVRYKGARLIYASPLRDAFSIMADPWLRVQPGGELALVLGLMRILALEGRQEFPGVQKEGGESLKGALERLDPLALETLSGVDRETLGGVVSVLSSTRRCAIVFGSGISQSPGALDKVRALANLALLLGCVGVGGGGIYPLDRGANTQGACDMGTLPEWLPGYRSMDDPDARAMAARLWGKELPLGPGWTLCEMMEAARRGDLKALYVMGENPLRMLPREAQEALERLDLLVVQDLFLTETAAGAHVLLPGAGFAEKDGTYTSLERRIQRVRPAMDPPGEARPDWWILAELLRRMGQSPEYDTAADVMKEIGAFVPEYRGVRYSRLEMGGIFWPCPESGGGGEAILHRGAEGLRMEMGPVDPIASLSPRDSEYPWTVLPAESRFHFGGGTRSGRSWRLRKFSPQPEVHLNPQDLATVGLADGDGVRLISRQGEITVLARRCEEVTPGFAWMVPGAGGTGMRDLMAWAWDPVTKMPQLHAGTVRIEKAQG